MNGAARRLSLAVPLLLAGCGMFRKPAPPPVPQPRYVVGAAYQAGNAWFYPREEFRLDATGLAVVVPDRAGLTANGELRDGAALGGTHDTLQLPAIARVTNLETGLQVLVRINDRGPAAPGRLLGLTRHAADLLGMVPGAPARVRLQLEDGPSQALRDQLGGAAIAVSSAPRGVVTAESLAPPPGVSQSTRGRTAAARPPAAEPAALATAVALSDTAVRVDASPGQLWIRAGEFGLQSYADQVRARLRGLDPAIERVRQGRSTIFRVRAGPFADVAGADSALDQATRAGVTDARIVVE